MDMRTGSTDRQRNIHAQPSNRLILCFDGTGNMFQGHPGDTNIVKLYNMFDRSNTSQMHYYQPGIEFLPWVIKRWEHIENPRDSGSYIWSYIGWPPNRGERRDIPSNALFHRSVIDRMALQPDPDPEKYRTNCYVPTNFLWVQDSSVQLKNGASKATTAPHAADTPHVVKRNLSELANRSSPKDCDCENETQPLVKSDIRFVLDNGLTKGSVTVEGESVVVGAKKSDGIYRVVLDSH